jgi:hypothetical protein
MDGKKRPIRHPSEFWDHYGIYVHGDIIEEGDLIFFSRNGTFSTHIGIVRDCESYFHAPGEHGTKVEVKDIKPQAIPTTNDRYKRLYMINPIGFKTPTVSLENPNYRYHQRPI